MEDKKTNENKIENVMIGKIPMIAGIVGFIISIISKDLKFLALSVVIIVMGIEGKYCNELENELEQSIDINKKQQETIHKQNEVIKRLL